MRFGTSESDSPYAGRGFQLRLLRWVILIGIVLAVLQYASYSSRNQVAKRPERGPANGSLDDGPLSPERGKLAGDEFRMDGDSVTTGRADFGRFNESETLRSGRNGTAGFGSAPPGMDPLDRPFDPKAAPEARARREEMLAEAQIDKSILDRVHDHTLGVRKDEADAFFRVLAHSKLIPQTYLNAAARDDLLHVNLITEPRQHRGELVRITGDLRRLIAFQSQDKQFDLGQLYEGWVFTPDSGTKPYRVVATSIPEGLAPAQSMQQPVTVVGYFFKLEGYNTEAGLQIAPVLLAQQIVMNRPVSAPPIDPGNLFYILAGLVTGGLVLGAVLMSFVVSEFRFQRRLRTLRQPVAEADLKLLSRINVTSPYEMLDQLAEVHRRQEQPDLDEFQEELQQLERQEDRLSAAYADPTPQPDSSAVVSDPRPTAVSQSAGGAVPPSDRTTKVDLTLARVQMALSPQQVYGPFPMPERHRT